MVLIMSESKKIGFDHALFIATKMRAQFVYDMAKLEGNTVSYAQAEMIVNGQSVAGLSMSETRQVDNIRRGWDLLIDELKHSEFNISKYNAIQFNMLVSEGENRLGYGGFRDGTVGIGGTDYQPPIHLELDAKWREMVDEVKKIENPLEQGLYLYATMSRNQFFGDGNKRTALMMMNGVLIENGYCPISISPVNEVEYRDLLIRYYKEPSKYKDPFYNFLKSEQGLMMKNGDRKK